MILLALLLAAPPHPTADPVAEFARHFVAVPEKSLPEGTPPFSVHRYEVWQDVYRKVMGANPSRWRGRLNAVDRVTFAEAQQFCAKATAECHRRRLIPADRVVTLPTPAQWELCCRAGTTTRYHFGDDAADLDRYAWHHGNAAGNDPAVGVLRPNAWGLHDTHGYLWEWCRPPGGKPVLRGGSWTAPADQCTCASELKPAPASRRPDVGFRCVLTGQSAIEVGRVPPASADKSSR